ncbi:MAG: 2-isopropylmalate synthase [Clostridiales bacterium]|nr:2-isopropylmalate synthase [Clostridiales bacterium]
MFENISDKYRPDEPVRPQKRKWPARTLDTVPIWCSVDMRDGNQALVRPLSPEDKLTFFKLLVKLGFKEIEIGYPSSSTTEFEFVRTLIDGGHIPDDVFIQVLTPVKENLIERTFESLKGAKNVILHFYNNLSPLHREVVFDTDLEGVSSLAINCAKIIKKYGDECKQAGMNIKYEYSPESFTSSNTDEVIGVCSKLMDILVRDEGKLIINLPATVENLMPNQFADVIEYFIENLPNREKAIIGVHPHNDRGTGVAAAEMALLAGAERIEGTLFGNGERSGNLDIITLALNMLSNGIDPKLDFSDILSVRKIYEKVTGMHVHERHPYAGQLVFTAFSGAHQDAINKGMHAMESGRRKRWAVPYLPIDPADIGRKYDSIIRINSQSGKGGAAYILETQFGYILPRPMRPDFGKVVQAETERSGSELSYERLYELFRDTYIDIDTPYRLAKYKFDDHTDGDGHSVVDFSGTLDYKDTHYEISGSGNGPIDAFFNAVRNLDISDFRFVSYSEHAVSSGSDSKAAAYIELMSPSGKTVFGVGLSHNIYKASIKGIICAINRALANGDI